jgi:hypothetical protein
LPRGRRQQSQTNRRNRTNFHHEPSAKTCLDDDQKVCRAKRNEGILPPSGKGGLNAGFACPAAIPVVFFYVSSP